MHLRHRSVCFTHAALFCGRVITFAEFARRVIIAEVTLSNFRATCIPKTV